MNRDLKPGTDKPTVQQMHTELIKSRRRKQINFIKFCIAAGLVAAGCYFEQDFDFKATTSSTPGLIIYVILVILGFLFGMYVLLMMGIYFDEWQESAEIQRQLNEVYKEQTQQIEGGELSVSDNEPVQGQLTQTAEDGALSQSKDTHG